MLLRFLSALLMLLAGGNVALADHATDWQYTLIAPATPVMASLEAHHLDLLYIITGIVIFVFLLLAYIAVRFNRRANPVPSKRTHNLPLEIVWTLAPMLILIVISVSAFKNLYYSELPDKDPEMTLKVVGHQWYWSYVYPESDNLQFDSYIIPDKDIKPGQLRLLEVDNPVVLPVDTTIRILVTSTDVIHSWAMPAFGIKKDAVPGRVNETWVRITKPGEYYGQCSELCGQGHGFMPIKVLAVSKEDYATWVTSAKQKFGNS